jgi:hypothetical protein
MHYIYIYRIWLGRVCNWCCNKIIHEITIDAHMYYRFSQKLKQLFGILFSFHRSASHQGFTDTTYSTENETRASHMWREHHTYDANITHVTRISHMWREHRTSDASMTHVTRTSHMWRTTRKVLGKLLDTSNHSFWMLQTFNIYLPQSFYTHTLSLSWDFLLHITANFSIRWFIISDK